jgi:hypothetical protein
MIAKQKEPYLSSEINSIKEIVALMKQEGIQSIEMLGIKISLSPSKTLPPNKIDPIKKEVLSEDEIKRMGFEEMKELALYSTGSF